MAGRSRFAEHPHGRGTAGADRGGGDPGQGQHGGGGEHRQVRPRDGQRRGRGVEYTGEHGDQHPGQAPSDGRARGQPDDREDGGLAADDGPQVPWSGAERGGDGEAAPPFGDPEAEDEAAGGGGQQHSEAEFDAGEPGQVDGGQAGPDDLPCGGDVGDRRGAGDQGVDPFGDRGAVLPAGVDEERADGVAAGALREVGGVGDEETVPGGGGKFVDNPGVPDRDGDRLVGAGIDQPQGDGVTGGELVVGDGFRRHQDRIRPGGQGGHQLGGGAAGEVAVLQGGHRRDGGRVHPVQVL